jgi:hypothetical protein
MKTRILGVFAPLLLAIGTIIAVPSVANAAAPCSGYTNIVYADRFNDSKGIPMATVYVYTKGTVSQQLDPETPTCGVLYAEGNYTAQSKYMGITLCSNYVGVPCSTNHGNFKEYAGPVYQAHGGCGSVTFVMKNAKGTTIVNGSNNTLGCE